MRQSNRVLLLGSGSSRDRRLLVGDRTAWDDQVVVTLDREPCHKPDVVHDLNVVPWPFEADTFEEVHAYEILEHLGSLGDERAFFDHFYEIWRILVPNGHLALTTPVWNGEWAFQDPGHRRVISEKSMIFLDRPIYSQVGVTAMSDYRQIWHGDFKKVISQETKHTFGAVLQAMKPVRS